MTGEDNPKEPTGAKAVRAYLIEPLEADGLVRKRGVSLEDHKAFLSKVAEKLAYCERETLERMRPILMGLAGGPAANVWPCYATVRNLAHTFQAPPDDSDKTLHGWLHSRAGMAARRNGTLLATRWFIKKFRKPPVVDGKVSTFMLGQIAERQRELDLDLDHIRERIAAGEATERERAWLEEQESILAGLDAIVDAGIRHRAEKAAEQEAAECA